VLCGRPMVAADLSYVDADNEHGAMQAVAHLVEQEQNYYQALQTHLAAGSGLGDIQGIEVGRIAEIVQTRAQDNPTVQVALLGLGQGHVPDRSRPSAPVCVRTVQYRHGRT
jgi:hypothetical protein